MLTTLAPPGTVLEYDKELEKPLPSKKQTQFRSGMMFVYNVLLGMELQVKLLMTLYCDNNGAVQLANNWLVGGRTRHVDIKQNFLRELKANGFLRVEWMSGTDLTPDMHTKNVPKILFDNYSKELVS